MVFEGGEDMIGLGSNELGGIARPKRLESGGNRHILWLK